MNRSDSSSVFDPSWRRDRTEISNKRPFAEDRECLALSSHRFDPPRNDVYCERRSLPSFPEPQIAVIAESVDALPRAECCFQLGVSTSALLTLLLSLMSS